MKLLADLDYKKDFQIIVDCELERLNFILNLVRNAETLKPQQTPPSFGSYWSHKAPHLLKESLDTQFTVDLW